MHKTVRWLRVIEPGGRADIHITARRANWVGVAGGRSKASPGIHKDNFPECENHVPLEISWADSLPIAIEATGAEKSKPG